MQYTKLGNSGINVSRLCVGCMSFGDPASNFHAWTLNPSESEDIVKHALSLSINFFDTANVYSVGTSEEYLGRAIRNNIAHNKVVLASKVYFNEGKLSKAAINREIEGTLTRLGTDYLDLYVIHRFDYSTPVEETMEVLDGLVKAGKVRALGASAMYGYQFAKLQGVALTPCSPLAAGRLSRSEWDAETKRNQSDKTAVGKYDGTKDSDIEIVKRVSELAQNHGVTMTQIALAWQFAKGVTAPLIGATKAKYFDDAVGSLEVGLAEEEVGFWEELYAPHKVMGAL